MSRSLPGSPKRESFPAVSNQGSSTESGSDSPYRRSVSTSYRRSQTAPVPVSPPTAAASSRSCSGIRGRRFGTVNAPCQLVKDDDKDSTANDKNKGDKEGTGENKGVDGDQDKYQAYLQRSLSGQHKDSDSDGGPTEASYLDLAGRPAPSANESGGRAEGAPTRSHPTRSLDRRTRPRQHFRSELGLTSDWKDAFAELLEEQNRIKRKEEQERFDQQRHSRGSGEFGVKGKPPHTREAFFASMDAPKPPQTRNEFFADLLQQRPEPPDPWEERSGRSSGYNTPDSLPESAGDCKGHHRRTLSDSREQFFKTLYEGGSEVMPEGASTVARHRSHSPAHSAVRTGRPPQSGQQRRTSGSPARKTSSTMEYFPEEEEISAEGIAEINQALNEPAPTCENPKIPKVQLCVSPPSPNATKTRNLVASVTSTTLPRSTKSLVEALRVPYEKFRGKKLIRSRSNPESATEFTANLPPANPTDNETGGNDGTGNSITQPARTKKLSRSQSCHLEDEEVEACTGGGVPSGVDSKGGSVDFGPKWCYLYWSGQGVR